VVGRLYLDGQRFSEKNGKKKIIRNILTMYPASTHGQFSYYSTLKYARALSPVIFVLNNF
jgi:hypothetical protein